MSVEHLKRKVAVSCSGCGKIIYRTIGTAARNEFHWCDTCWPLRNRENERNNYRNRAAGREKKNPGRKRILNSEQEKEVIRLKNTFTQKELSAWFGISVVTIRKIQKEREAGLGKSR